MLQTMEREKPELQARADQFSDFIQNNPDFLGNVIRDLGLDVTKPVYNDGKTVVQELSTKALVHAVISAASSSGNVQSLKSVKQAMASVYRRYDPKKTASVHLRLVKVRPSPATTAKIGGLNEFMMVYMLCAIDVEKVPELLRIFGKNARMHLNPMYGFIPVPEISDAMVPALLYRNTVVVDHFVSRFTERVYPEENFTRYSEHEAALADFLLCGPRFWGHERQYAAAYSKETKTFVEAFKVHGLPIVYFFGNGSFGITTERMRGTLILDTQAHLNTCITENELTPTRREIMKILCMTGDTWDQGRVGKIDGWVRSPNIMVISDGTPMGRR